MTSRKTAGLTIRNGIAGTTGPMSGELATTPANGPSPDYRCDRGWRIRLMREAYTALLRKERAPVA